MVFTMKRMKECKNELEKRGYVEVLTSMSDCGDERFGILYKKNDKEFWLNINTYNKLPE